ncbi:MAG: hypothetical protein PHI85_07590 [Victivallaceae bacterium]|nr:hypothetical protein [Victivallaceae bacterium]
MKKTAECSEKFEYEAPRLEEFSYTMLTRVRGESCQPPKGVGDNCPAGVDMLDA